jgi:hypothetical protein
LFEEVNANEINSLTYKLNAYVDRENDGAPVGARTEQRLHFDLQNSFSLLVIAM